MKTVLWFVIIVTLTCGCARHGIISGRIPPIPAPQYTDPSVIKGFALTAAKSKTGKDLHLISEGQAVEEINSILDRLVKANSANYTYHGFVVADDKINAFTDGRAIYVYAKMLSVLRSEEDLVAVVSHELAHITAGHLTIDKKSLENRKVGVAVASALTGVALAALEAHSNPSASFDTVKEMAKTGGQVAGAIGSATFIQPYSRDQEREADEIGMMMAARAQYNPASFVDFWTNSDKILGPSNAGLLSDHPSNAERAAHLKASFSIAKAYYDCAITKAKAHQVSPTCAELERKSSCTKKYCLDFRVP